MGVNMVPWHANHCCVSPTIANSLLYVECPNRGIDLAFALDSSGSVGEQNFALERQLVSDIVNRFAMTDELLYDCTLDMSIPNYFEILIVYACAVKYVGPCIKLAATSPAIAQVDDAQVKLSIIVGLQKLIVPFIQQCTIQV